MKTNFPPFVLILAGFLCLTFSGQAQGNLLAATNWTVQENQADFVVPTITSNGDYSVSFFTWDSFEAPPNLVGTINQTIATTPGTTYDLTFQAIQFDGVDASSVSINGDLLANFTPDDPFISPVNNFGGGPFNASWYGFDYSFIASSATTTISFSEAPEAYFYPENTPVFIWSKVATKSPDHFTLPKPST